MKGVMGLEECSVLCRNGLKKSGFGRDGEYLVLIGGHRVGELLGKEQGLRT